MEVRSIYFLENPSSACNIPSRRLSCQSTDSQGRGKVGKYGSRVKCTSDASVLVYFTNRVLTEPQVKPASQSQFSLHLQPIPRHFVHFLSYQERDISTKSQVIGNKTLPRTSPNSSHHSSRTCSQCRGKQHISYSISKETLVLISQVTGD